MSFGGVDVTEELEKLGGRAIVTDVTRNVASQFNNTYQDQGSRRYGQTQLYSTLSVKPIQVSLKLVGMQTFFNAAQEKLGGILNTPEEQELIFGDEPNKVWMALPNSQQTATVDNSTSPPTATITLTFDVPNAYAESKVSASISNKEAGKYGSIVKQADGSYRATINNLGTAETEPTITIKHNSDNGYVGVVNASGAKAVGNEEEVDTVQAQKSEELLKYSGTVPIANGLATGKTNVAVLNDKTWVEDGTLGVETVWGRPHLRLSDDSRKAGRHSGTLTWDIPADSEGGVGSLYDYVWWRQIFWIGSAMQCGSLQVTFTDTDGEFLYGAETIKRHSGTLNTEYNILVADGKGGARILEARNFSATHLDTQNPFNSTRGWSDLLRSDDQLQFYWWGSYPKRTVPELKGKKSAKLNVTFNVWGNLPMPTHMYLDEIVYRKDFVEYTKDIPNLFGAGSSIVLDMAKDKTYINNLPASDKEVTGSVPLTVPVGTSELDIYLSSWVSKDPEITVEWKERYV